MKRYWLIKSEPDAFSIDDLEKKGSTSWDGVRNYQARNFMRDDMKLGDLALFYHSSTKPPGIVGVARVSRESYPDHTQFDKKSKYYDPKAKRDDPTWYMVDFEFVERFERVFTLDDLKATEELEGMLVTRRGQRLSIQPVEPEHFRAARKLARAAR